MDDAEVPRDNEPPAPTRHGTETRRRYANLTIRLLPEERACIEAAAERTGLTLGSYARAHLVPKSAIKSVRRAPIEAALLAQLLGQVGKVGGNIHQIIKRVNFNEGVPRTEIDAAIADWRTVAQQIMQTLGREADHADGD